MREIEDNLVFIIFIEANFISGSGFYFEIFKNLSFLRIDNLVVSDLI